MLNFRDDKHWYGITHDGRDTIGAHRLNTLPFPKCSSISLLLPCGWMSFLSLLEVLHIHHLPLRTFRIFCILTGQSVESAKSARGNHQKNRSKADVSTMHNRIDNKHRFYASYEGLEAKSAQGSEYLVWSVARVWISRLECSKVVFRDARNCLATLSDGANPLPAVADFSELRKSRYCPLSHCLNEIRQKWYRNPPIISAPTISANKILFFLLEKQVFSSKSCSFPEIIILY